MIKKIKKSEKKLKKVLTLRFSGGILSKHPKNGGQKNGQATERYAPCELNNARKRAPRKGCSFLEGNGRNFI